MTSRSIINFKADVNDFKNLDAHKVYVTIKEVAFNKQRIKFAIFNTVACTLGIGTNWEESWSESSSQAA